MSYVKPSPLIYQDLLSSGGVLNSTPDLEACIIGPAYNVVSYVPGSTASQIATAAYSSVSTTGSISAGLYALTVVSTAGFLVGQSIIIVGASTSGSNLQAVITNITGNVITVDTAAVTTVTGAKVTPAAVLTNTTINNTYSLASTKPGQVVTASSVQVWLNNSSIQTMTTGVSAMYSSNVLAVLAPTTTGSITTGTSTLTVASATGLFIGDTVTVAGAGPAGAVLTAVITNIVSTTITLGTSAGTTVSSVAVAKVAPNNTNSSTNTLRATPGDAVVISYTNNASVAKTYSSTLLTVTTSSGLNGNITQFTTTDMMPSDMSVATTGNITSGSPTLTVASATGIAIGKKVFVKGAGAAGADLVANVTNVVSTTITLDTNAGTTVTTAQVLVFNNVQISVRKAYNDLQVPAINPATSGNNYDTTNVSSAGTVTINSGVAVNYGSVISGSVYIGYSALRTDLANQVLTINDANDLVGQLGVVSDANPLALGISIALANTITRIRAIAVASNDLIGYTAALTAAQGERLYFLVPLTQDTSILSAFDAHCEQLSTPVSAAWRVAIVNTAIPTTLNIGQYSSTNLNTNGGNNAVALSGSNYVLTASNATFISDGAVPGDMVNITSVSTGTPGSYQIQTVVSNQQVVINATGAITGANYYVSRPLTKSQSANSVMLASQVFGDKRVWHVQPDIVGVSIGGVTKYLPGYYLCCGLAGMGAGFPVQQGFTNIGVAGISDLSHSNYYFSQADLNTMASGGTCVFVQDTQGGIPYCRHAMTTDISTLEYREQLVVKNWDFLSYFYYDKVKSFIGRWNITPDTINTIRQTLISSSELVKSQKLPKIGAPLLGYKILDLTQDVNNKDTLVVHMSISIVYPLNYLQLHLEI